MRYVCIYKRCIFSHARMDVQVLHVWICLRVMWIACVFICVCDVCVYRSYSHLLSTECVPSHAMANFSHHSHTIPIAFTWSEINSFTNSGNSGYLDFVNIGDLTPMHYWPLELLLRALPGNETDVVHRFCCCGCGCSGPIVIEFLQNYSFPRNWTTSNTFLDPKNLMTDLDWFDNLHTHHRHTSFQPFASNSRN